MQFFLDPIIHINTEKKQYRNIPATKYTILHASSLQNVMQTTESQVLPPLLNPRSTDPPPPIFFLLLKKMLRLKINILSSIYPEINFPAESVMKINNLSRPKVPAPPLQDQMVVPNPTAELVSRSQSSGGRRCWLTSLTEYLLCMSDMNNI